MGAQTSAFERVNMFRNTDLLTTNDPPGKYPNSWYTAITPKLDPFPTMQGDQGRFDVCIIGAGYTGLSAALHLRKEGFKVCVVEAHRAGWGASGRNGGQVGSGQRRDQYFLEQEYGEALAKDYWYFAEDAKALVKELINKYQFACDPVTGIIEADHKERFVKHTNAYVDLLRSKYGYEDISFLDRQNIRERIKSEAYFGGSYDKGAFHINPLGFAVGLAKVCMTEGVTIFENSRVKKVGEGDPMKVETKEGLLSADRLVFACNGYLNGLQKDIARRVVPINNFIIATEPLDEATAKTVMNTKAAVADSKFVINYFRLAKSEEESGRRLIFGGGENYGIHFPSDITKFVSKPMLKIFPQLKGTKIDYGWGGTLAITKKRLPHFCYLKENIISCSGYSGHGIAIATFAGKLIAETLSGNAEKFDKMSQMNIRNFPGAPKFKVPMLALAMVWYTLRDRF